jgi:TetR/AcrR family transcriptional repressor of nem operon
MTPNRPANQSSLRNLDSLEELADWTDSLIAHHSRQLASATPPGGIDESTLAWLLRTWEDLAEGFVRLRDKNLLLEGACPEDLATAFMAALEGGYLLSATARHISPLEVSVKMALQLVARSMSDGSSASCD